MQRLPQVRDWRPKAQSLRDRQHQVAERRADADVFANRVTTLLRDHGARLALAQAGPQDAWQWRAPALVERVAELYAGLAARRNRNESVATALV